MTREIILVEVVNGDYLSTDDCRAFTDSQKADEYFEGLVFEYRITDDLDEVKDFLEDGYVDFNNEYGEKMSIITKCITFEED